MLFRSAIPNGKVYKAPPSVQNGSVNGRKKGLQEQCEKLQQLQKQYHQSPSVPSLKGNGTANGDSQEVPTSNGRSFRGEKQPQRSHYGDKPVIAPKPQAPKRNTSFARQDSQKSDGSSGSSTSLSDYRSTTV